jgi:translation initiation factor IF-2
MGGEILCVETSAKTGEGIEDLLEAIDLTVICLLSSVCCLLSLS